VVRHLVLDHLEAERVRPVHHVPQRGQVAEALFDRVEVDRSVAVVVVIAWPSYVSRSFLWLTLSYQG